MQREPRACQLEWSVEYNGVDGDWRRFIKRYLLLLLLHYHTSCHAVPLTADSLSLEATECTKLKFDSAPLQGTPATVGADFITLSTPKYQTDQGHLVFQTYLDR